jgi:hypothetical protein
VNLVRVTGGGSGIRLVDRPVDDGVSDGESFAGRKVFPEIPEKSFEAVMMVAEGTGAMTIRLGKTATP